MKRIPVAAGLIAATFSLVPLGAQQPDTGSTGTPERPLTGIVTASEGSRIPIAIAPPIGGGGQPPSSELARTMTEIASTVRMDLEATGYFDLVPEERSRLVPGASAGSVPPLKDWLSVGADAVLSLLVTPQSAKLSVEAQLYDARSSERMLGRLYGGDADQGRRIAHRLSDDIVHQLTGQEGIAQSRIAYVVATAPGVKEIMLMDYDGARPRRLTEIGSLCLAPAWSPDGARLAYLSYRGRTPGIDIVDGADGRITRLPTSGGDLNMAPDWSPDGKRIAFSSNRDGDSEIYVMNLQTREERRLTSNDAIDTAPSWSPTGREIAFTSDRAGGPQIYIMDSEGINVRRLTYDGNYNESAAWSPRGDRIAYVSRIEGHFDIYVYDLARGGATRITAGVGNNENPRWSPDGRHLVFSSNRSGSYRIYTMGADGSDPRALTTGAGAFTPDWSR